MSRLTVLLPKRTLAALVVIALVYGPLVLIAVPAINPGFQFFDVVGYVDRDPRNPAILIFREPNLNNSLGWSITEYHWRHGPFIDWSQVDHFLNSLDYHNATAYWCSSYQVHPDDNVWIWFVWFQKSETDFEFLYPSRVWY